MSTEAWLQQIWYGGRRAPWWLRALSPLFGMGVRSRHWLYAHGWRRPVRVAAPVIVVGNISAGGTGKTPLVIWLAGRLARLGLADPGRSHRDWPRCDDERRPPCRLDRRRE